MTMECKRLPRTEAVWQGQSVYRFKGMLADLEGALPRFARVRLTHEDALNEYLDLVLREPTDDDDRRVPVATVSRRYALIQHQDAVAWVRKAFEEQEWDPSTIGITAWMSEYGERFRAEIALPVEAEAVNVGDMLRAEVRLWNSVDRSRAFEVAIGWMRLICTNGLAVWSGDRLRKIHHVDWMSRESPMDFLLERLPKSRDQVAELRRWAEVKITMDRLVGWVDGDVSGKWGKTRAARVLHISRTGSDCAVGRHAEARKPSELEVTGLAKVPGAPAKTDNVYDLYQTLLWLAGQEKSLEQRESMTAETLPLIAPLLPQSMRGAAA